MLYQSSELIAKACKDIDESLQRADVKAAKHYLQVIRGLARTPAEKELIGKYNQLIIAVAVKEASRD